MKKSIWSLLLSLTVVVAVAGVFYVLYPERFIDGPTLPLAVLVAAAASGTLVYLPLAESDPDAAGSGRVGPLGIGTFGAIILFLVAAVGIGCALSGLDKVSLALDIVAVAGFIALFIVKRAHVQPQADTGKRRGSSVSSHTSWADRLEGIARGCGMPFLKPRLLKLAGETRYLASDDGSYTFELNQRIAGALDSVADAVRRGDEQLALHQLKRLRNLFAERETELTNLKSLG